MEKKEQRIRRKKRVRKKIYGTAERPRLSVARSLKHIRAQIINDDLGITYVAASSLDKEIREDSLLKEKKEKAKKVGELLAKRAKEKGITKVVFDRGCFQFAGRIKALADGAKIGGLEF